MVEQKRLPDHGFKFSEESNWNDIQLESNKIFFSKPLIIDVSGLAKGFAVDKAYKRISFCYLNMPIKFKFVLMQAVI